MVWEQQASLALRRRPDGGGESHLGLRFKDIGLNAKCAKLDTVSDLIGVITP